jgi:hypothetical protein
MVFGIRERKTTLGVFTSDRCGACKKSIEYRMEKTVRYLVVFGVNLLPLRVRYESVCKRCGEREPVKSRAARGLAYQHFFGAQAKQQLFMALRLLIAAAVIAALAILPLTIKMPVSRDREALKALAGADGDYAVMDREGELLAIVHAESGANTLVWCDQVSLLTGTGSKGGRFYLHEAFQEASDSAGNTILIRSIDDPGWLVDQYDSIVRLYSYNEEKDALSFYQGVEDLSAIEYTTRRVTYPYISFDDEGQKQQYVTVLHLLRDARLRAQFMPSASGEAMDRLVAVFIDTLDAGRVTDQQYYYFDDEAISLARQAGLTQGSDAQAFADFIRINGLSATITCHYEFFGNTGVIASETQMMPDANGDMQTTAAQYDITEKDGYYIFPYSAQ